MNKVKLSIGTTYVRGAIDCRIIFDEKDVNDHFNLLLKNIEPVWSYGQWSKMLINITPCYLYN